jgi:hypothetical protein
VEREDGVCIITAMKEMQGTEHIARPLRGWYMKASHSSLSQKFGNGERHWGLDPKKVN